MRFTSPSTFTESFNLIAYSISDTVHLCHFYNLDAHKIFWFSSVVVEVAVPLTVVVLVVVLVVVAAVEYINCVGCKYKQSQSYITAVAVLSSLNSSHCQE